MKAEVLLIIPFYNESKRISIEEFQQAFEAYSHIDFLLSDDGSTDTTVQMLKNFEAVFSNVTVLAFQENSGKAETIRKAVLHLADHNYKYIGCIDADLATPIAEIEKMRLFTNNNTMYKFVMGSRIKKLGNTIVRYNYRHYIGRIFATIISNILLKTPVYDTQCGAKIICGKLAPLLFAAPFTTKWFFDVELLLRYKKITPDYHKYIYEFVLDVWKEKGSSKITFTDMVNSPFQLAKIYFKYKC